ncbi:hypothetical protein H1R20_g1391, partial [Candolleomyces eurysporus]
MMPLLCNPQHQSSHCPQPTHAVNVHESPPPDSSLDTGRLNRSLFRNAQNFQTGDWHVTTVHTSRSIDGWEVLQKHTAPNALHDSSARFDAPKCDEDTRIEVTDEIMGFIKDRDHPQRLLCMTGAAGSGKSALQQTIAERCAKGNILGAAYFISVADAKRNTASTIVPTIAYQLGLHHPTLQRFVAAEVEHDPLIFSRSLITQMDVLVVRPFKNLRRSNECDTSTFPYVILIDGLDECQGEPSTTTDLGRVKMKYKAEDRQTEFLAAIRNSLLNSDLPFRVFIASRPELPIRTALGPTGSLHGLAYEIQLSDQYDATEDMRRYLRRRFQDIGLRIGQPDWFTEGNIETLVQAGSGQFVYVATVFKYVSERRASPVHTLKTVLNWTPGQATRPFEALDMLYTNILSNAKEAYEAVDAHKLHSLPDEWEDMSVSEQHLITAIPQLYCLVDAVAIDEIVDFTHKGGWQKIDMVLSKPLGFGIIFKNSWAYAANWIDNLDESADDSKKRRPEVAAIMSKYLEKWKHVFNERFPEAKEYHFDTDLTSSGLDDESSDSD